MDANDISGIEPVVLEAGLSGTFEEHTSDQQGIDWHRLHQRRDDYRAERLAQYRNYTNVIEPRLARYKNLRQFHEGELGGELTDRPMDASLYRFYRNFPQVHSNIVHFQLRNLIWSTSCHDLYVVCGNCIRHWNMLTGRNRVILDLTGKQQHGGQGSRYMGVVHISTSCVKNGLAAAGGFSGEIVLASVTGKYHWGMRVSNSDNCITNGLELAEGHSGASLLIAANNDNRVRVLDVETKNQSCSIDLPWASNGASMCPTRRSMIAVVGDDQDVHLHDMSSCRPVLSLKGHLDWSFAVSWHPNGNLLATGNQDCTTRIWDVRSPGEALDVLPSEMGSVRSCRFSPDGLSLAVSEPADFVHVYDVKNGMARGQDINFFGEISGIAFSPSSSSLFIGIPDQMYNSVLCYHKDSQDDTQML